MRTEFNLSSVKLSVSSKNVKEGRCFKIALLVLPLSITSTPHSFCIKVSLQLLLLGPWKGDTIMVTKQSHIPTGAWPSGKNLCRPRAWPSNHEQFPNAGNAEEGLVSSSLRLPHPAERLLVFHIHCLSNLTVCYGSAIDSTFQAAGIVLHFVKCPRALLSHLLKLCFLLGTTVSTGWRVGAT